MEQLRDKGEVDALKVIEVRRRLLKARDGYLDALWEAIQAQADLATAVGAPALAIGSCGPSPKGKVRN